MGGRVAPTNFPNPGAIGSAQQGANAVLNPAAGPQPSARLGAFNPASILPTTAAPAPAPAQPTNDPFNIASARGNRLNAFDQGGGMRNRISMGTDY